MQKKLIIDERYTVFSNGDIIGPKGKKLKQFLNSGYCQVRIGCTTRKVHRLVAMSFLPMIHGKSDINHKNGIKTDNRVENLEWSNDSHNIQHAFRTGLRTHKGENNTRAVIPKEHVPIIREAISAGFNPKLIAEYYGTHKNAIYQIKYNKTWSHV